MCSHSHTYISLRSLVDQVTLWKQYLSPPPAVVPWKSNDSLFAIWIGINDVVCLHVIRPAF